jgi:hypothetical protein
MGLKNQGLMIPSGTTQGNSYLLVIPKINQKEKNGIIFFVAFL